MNIFTFLWVWSECYNHLDKVIFWIFIYYKYSPIYISCIRVVLIGTIWQSSHTQTQVYRMENILEKELMCKHSLAVINFIGLYIAGNTGLWHFSNFSWRIHLFHLTSYILLCILIILTYQWRCSLCLVYYSYALDNSVPSYDVVFWSAVWGIHDEIKTSFSE